MTALIERTSDLLKQAATIPEPKPFLADAVSLMEREEVEKLAVAYLLNEMKRTKPSVARTQLPKLRRSETTPEDQAKFDAHFRKIEQEREARSEDIRADFKRSMDKAFAQLKEAWKLEWTEEILNTEIPLPDGTVVKFRDATAAQHHHRAQTHRRNTMLNMEAAVRHEKAIEAIAAAGARTLGEATES